MIDPFRLPGVLALVRLALDEDVGRGDVTTAATIPRGARGAGRISTREPIVVAGLAIVEPVFEALGASVEVELHAEEGGRAAAGDLLVSLHGETAALLAAERTLLNFLQRLCGVATLTRRYVDALAGGRAAVVDTRKTVPGWRLLDKYAVRMGGGENHRFGLDDGILIKDNHIAACGGVAEAVSRARQGAPHLLRVEVECETMADVDAALGAGAEVILLDNMSPRDLAAAVRRIGGRAVVEASGGVTLERLREIAETGVDLISIGALTHSAPSANLTMELTPELRGADRGKP